MNPAVTLTAGPWRRTVSEMPHGDALRVLVHDALCLTGCWPHADPPSAALDAAVARLHADPVAWLAAAPSSTPRPRREPVSCALGVDVGGSDLKLSVIHEGAVVLREQVAWPVAPARLPSADAWAAAIADVARGVRDAAAARGHRAARLGLALPDVVEGDRIVFGLTGKTAGMRAALGAAFDAHRVTTLRDLPGTVGRRVGLDVRAIGDGEAAALAVDGSTGRHLCLSLGTSLTGALREHGGVRPIPRYASGFVVPDLAGAPGPRHDVLGVAGTLQHGPTRKGVLAHARAFGLTPPPNAGAAWVDALRADETPAVLTLCAALGERLGRGVAAMLAWLGPVDAVWLTGAMVAPAGTGAATRAVVDGVRRQVHVPVHVHDEAVFAQADAVARLAAEGG